jgi:hypothetical protein
MNRDLEIASILEDEAIPFSLEYFLGIAEKDEDMEDDEGDDSNSDDDEDSDDEPAPPKGKKKISGDKKAADPK